MPNKVAVVTGSNRGIGYAIVKSLCEKFIGDVYLTARNEEHGLAAVEKLNKLGYRPKFHSLDITIPESCEKLQDHLVELYGGLDILINNAAIAFKNNAPEPFAVQADETTRVNYFALRRTCDILFPILKPHARVVNLSSSYGHLSRIPCKQLRDILASDDLTVEKLDNLVNSFVSAARNGTHAEEGWPNNTYSVSKIAVSALSRMQQKIFLKDERPDVIINHVHPEQVDTEMNSHTGTLTIEQGAEAPVFLAILPENCTKPKGEYVWFTKEVVDWVNGPLPPN